MNRYLRTGIALLPLVMIAACGGTTKDSGSSSSGAAIVLGTSLSLTGSLGTFGVNLKAGYEQKVSELNAAGGITVGGTKRHVTLTVLDNRSDPDTATEQVRELSLKDGAVALLGACTPQIVVPEALAAEKLKVPFVSSCNPVHAFQAGNKSGWSYAWDLFFDEQDQASSLATAFQTVNSNNKVALFTDTEPDGVAERPLYKTAMQAAGLDVVGDYTFPVGTTDFSSFINDAKAKGAQLVAGQMVPPDGIALWKQMKSLNYKPAAAYVAKASSTKSWTKALGPIADGTLGNSFWSPQTGKANSQALLGTLGKQYPDDLPDMGIAVVGYTVAAIVLDAVTAAASTQPAAINTALGKTDADYPLGHIAFGASTHTATTPILVNQWQNNNIVVIVPTTPGATLQSPVKGLQ